MILRLCSWIPSHIVLEGRWRLVNVFVRLGHDDDESVSHRWVACQSSRRSFVTGRQGGDKQCMIWRPIRKSSLDPPIPIDQQMVSYESLPSGSRGCCGENGFEAFAAKAGRTSLLEYEL